MAVGTADITPEILAAAHVIPAGRHSLTRDEVALSQLARLVRGMADAVAEHGYVHTTVAHVVALAGVSRKTFYEHFADKEACFLAAYDVCAAMLEARLLAPGTADPGDLPAAVRERVTAYLGALADEPSMARAFLVEVQGAGPAALARRAAIHERWAGYIRLLHDQARAADPSLPELPPAVARAALGAVHELVVDALASGDDVLSLTEVAVSIQTALLTHDHGAPAPS